MNSKESISKILSQAFIDAGFELEQEIHIEGLYLETVQTALLDYQLQTGNKLDVLEIPNLNRQYLTTNIEDYV
mgnify:CR=1 FL=1